MGVDVGLRRVDGLVGEGERKGGGGGGAFKGEGEGGGTDCNKYKNSFSA